MSNLPEQNAMLLNEGLLDKFPILASLGLASALQSSELQAGDINLAHQKDIAVQPVKYTVPKDISSATSSSMFNYISKWEGLRNKVYNDHTGKPTIGIGHYLNNSASDRQLVNNLFRGKVNYDKLLNGTEKLSNDQVEKLFNVDVKLKEKLASRLIPSYTSFDQNTKNAIVNALYRGDMGKKTIAAINNADWKLAAKEYLNHPNARSGKEQVMRRMKTNAAIFYKNSLNK